jgi:hypothetical protein
VPCSSHRSTSDRPPHVKRSTQNTALLLWINTSTSQFSSYYFPPSRRCTIVFTAHQHTSCTHPTQGSTRHGCICTTGARHRHNNDQTTGPLVFRGGTSLPPLANTLAHVTIRTCDAPCHKHGDIHTTSTLTNNPPSRQNAFPFLPYMALGLGLAGFEANGWPSKGIIVKRSICSHSPKTSPFTAITSVSVAPRR